jgi:hypothetical protein
VQGYDVSGPLPLTVAATIDRDFTILFGARISIPRSAGTVGSNVDYLSRPTAFASGTVSCQALPHFCTS